MNPYIQSKEVKRQQLSEDWGKKKGQNHRLVNIERQEEYDSKQYK